MAEEKSSTAIFSDTLFSHIFKTFRISLRPSKLLTAFLAVAALFILGTVMDLSRTVAVSGQIDGVTIADSISALQTGGPTELHVYISNPQGAADYRKSTEQRIGVFATFSGFACGRLNEAFVSILELDMSRLTAQLRMTALAVVWLLTDHTIYSLIYLTFTFVILAIAGGAICRSSALQLSRDERPGLAESVKFSTEKFKDFFLAPVVPIIAIILLGACIFIIGLIANIPWFGELVMALLVVLPLLAGLMIALLLVVTVCGTGLMFGAVAYENTTSIDAAGQSFRYIYSRPWLAGLYAMAAVFHGSVCYLFVRLLAFLSLSIARGCLEFGLWADASAGDKLNKVETLWPRPHFFHLLGSKIDISRNLTESISAFIIHIGVLIEAGLVAAFVISYAFSAWTIIYALLRKKIDNKPLEEIYVKIEQLQQADPETPSG